MHYSVVYDYEWMVVVSEMSSTKITASLAATVRMSAQETIPGHSDSSLFLMLSMILNPFKACMLLGAFFSP